jgi:hypothetical protein
VVCRSSRKVLLLFFKKKGNITNRQAGRAMTHVWKGKKEGKGSSVRASGGAEWGGEATVSDYFSQSPC